MKKRNSQNNVNVKGRRNLPQMVSLELNQNLRNERMYFWQGRKNGKTKKSRLKLKSGKKLDRVRLKYGLLRRLIAGMKTSMSCNKCSSLCLIQNCKAIQKMIRSSAWPGRNR